MPGLPSSVKARSRRKSSRTSTSPVCSAATRVAWSGMSSAMKPSRYCVISPFVKSHASPALGT